MIRHLAAALSSLSLLTLVVTAGRIPTPGAGDDEAPAPQTAREALPPGARLIGIDAHPARIEIDRRYGYAQLLLTGRLEDGQRIDVTRAATLLAADEPCVSVSPRGVVRALADGEGVLEFALQDQRVRVPVVVSGQGERFAASFVQDVMPILSKVGCTAGGCHGAADGKNGFKLSLRGYDPEADHGALTDDLAGRRFNRAFPEQSLFLLKPTASVPHGGGRRMELESPEYETLRAWVTDGARYDGDNERAVSIEIFPEDPWIPRPGMNQQIAVLATYADGRVRDVTLEAFIETNDIEVTQIDDLGLVTALRRGEAAILARYEGCYAATRLLAGDDREGWEWVDVPAHNYVDELVHAKLRRVRCLPSEPCTDAAFLRRVHLDLTGLAPTAKQTRTFLMDERDSRLKRDEVIDRLIGSADFVDHWTNKWCDLLQVNSKFLGAEGAEIMRLWVRGQVASNVPYDEFVASILSASGSTYDNPAAGYYKVLREPDVAMENTTQLFLGVRFSCNKCHDHPFERWTRDQHWQLAAYFGRVGRQNAEGSPLMPRANQVAGTPPAFEEIISDLAEGEVIDPLTGAVVEPSLPYLHAGGVPADAGRRQQLTTWLTAAENPYFAKSYANRVWSYFLGVGLIEPVDDIRAGNPPTNPELLQRLTDEFVSSGFDVRALMRTICRSRTYQRSIGTNRWNADDTINYSHAVARRLPAEVLFDAVHQATGSTTRLPGVLAGTHATELIDGSVEARDGFLGLFGRPPRESACECERTTGVSLGQALSLVNGPTVAEAIEDPRNRIADLVAVEEDAGAIVDELYLWFLCRPPRSQERAEFARSLDPTDLENRAALGPEAMRALAEGLADWERSIVPIAWHTLAPDDSQSRGGASLTTTEDGSILVTGAAPDADTYTLVVFTDRPAITGIRLEVLPDPSFPAGGPGRAENGNFVLGELRVVAIPVDDPRAARPVGLQNASADFSQSGWPVAAAIDGKPETGWAVTPHFGEPHQAVFETTENIGGGAGTILIVTLDQPYGSKHTIGRLRLSVTDAPRPVRHHGLPDDVARVLATPAAERTREQEATIHAHYVSKHPKIARRIRLGAAQDLAWALVNSPAFLFNR